MHRSCHYSLRSVNTVHSGRGQSFLLATLGLLLSLFQANAELPDSMVVPIPPGETPLANIGYYEVGWQSYGKEPVMMPWSWVGHFDDRTGVSYQPWGQVLDREALLIHSAWRMPPGPTWVNYRIALPQTTPIKLDFGITMGPDVAVSGKSDGVTFSCRLLADGQSQELMRQHYAQGAWRDYSFDLSRFAGKTVTLTLQVEPGPNNDPGFDFSFFGDARITVGDTKPDRAALLKQVTSTQAYRALEAATRASSRGKSALLKLSNQTNNGVVPANLLPCKNSVERSGAAWRLAYKGADCRIVYTYTPSTGTLEDFSVQVDDGLPFKPALGGGASAVVTNAGVSTRRRLEGGKPVEVTRDGTSLKVIWEYPLAEHPVRVEWRFTPIGKSLGIVARCADPVIESFSLGDIG
ncbi:MAG TPA: hypothetical protein VEC99_03270, partial [Clostridia bacterium]|nr:hypothetical protein [Clostridia bacterium]